MNALLPSLRFIRAHPFLPVHPARPIYSYRSNHAGPVALFFGVTTSPFFSAGQLTEGADSESGNFAKYVVFEKSYPVLYRCEHM